MNSMPIAKITIDTSDGKLVPYGSTDLSQLLVDHDPKRPLVIYFHGALVDRQIGFENAQTYSHLWSSAVGQNLPADSIFYIYDSDIGRELFKALKELLFRDFVLKLIELVAQHFGGQLPAVVPQPQLAAAAAGFDPGIDDNLYQAILHDAVINEDLKAFANNDRATVAFALLSDPAKTTFLSESDRVTAEVDAGIATALTPDNCERNALGFGVGFSAVKLTVQLAIKAVLIYRAVKQRQTNLRDHGDKQTITEEIIGTFLPIGPKTWEVIKREVDVSFSNSPRAAGTLFLNALNVHLAQNPDRKVFLIGHSTGSIYVAQMLLGAAARKMKTQFHVRLLAGAATMSLYEKVFNHANANIASIRNYGLGAQEEIDNHVLNIKELKKTPFTDLYKGSLLYIVSGCFENAPDTPLVGMHRFYEVDSKRVYSPEEEAATSAVANGILDPNRVWSVCNQCQAKEHGGFMDDQASFNDLLRT